MTVDSMHHHLKQIHNISVHVVEHLFKDNYCLKYHKFFFTFILVFKCDAPSQQPAVENALFQRCKIELRLNSMLFASFFIFVTVYLRIVTFFAELHKFCNDRAFVQRLIEVSYHPILIKNLWSHFVLVSPYVILLFLTQLFSYSLFSTYILFCIIYSCFHHHIKQNRTVVVLNFHGFLCPNRKVLGSFCKNSMLEAIEIYPILIKSFSLDKSLKHWHLAKKFKKFENFKVFSLITIVFCKK